MFRNLVREFDIKDVPHVWDELTDARKNKYLLILILGVGGFFILISTFSIVGASISLYVLGDFVIGALAGAGLVILLTVFGALGYSVWLFQAEIIFRVRYWREVGSKK